MLKKYFLIIPILLSACAQQKMTSQLEQGKQCWIDAKSEFVAANPDSPALWFLPDNYVPTPKDLRNKSKVTALEQEHLGYFMKAYQDCYAPVMQLTGDDRYDDVLRNTYYSNFITLIDLSLYMNGKITRGEYFKRYAKIKSRFDAANKHALSVIK